MALILPVTMRVTSAVNCVYQVYLYAKLYVEYMDVKRLYDMKKGRDFHLGL